MFFCLKFTKIFVRRSFLRCFYKNKNLKKGTYMITKDVIFYYGDKVNCFLIKEIFGLCS